MKKIATYILVLASLYGCDGSKSKFQNPNATETKELNEANLSIRDMVSKNIVIAHRGSVYWAPEETEPAFRWARNIGADYLELDVQMTKDSILVALHDNTLLRTSNVRDVFPDLEKPTTNDLTLKQLRSLDFGSKFNKKYPDRARESYVGTKILTLQDVIMIAEGYHIKKYENGEPEKVLVDGVWNGKYEYELDPKDNKNRPGIYVETKKLHLEELLAKELKEYGWLMTDNPKEIETFKGKVGIANTDSRLILQTFYKRSITKLNQNLPGIPKCYLIWGPDFRNNVEIKDKAKLDSVIKKSYIEAINFCVDNDVQIIGSSITGEPNDYEELTAPWMVNLVHKSGIIVHPYTFNTTRDFDLYGNNVDGVFTNRADLALIFYNRMKKNISVEVLEDLGY